MIISIAWKNVWRKKSRSIVVIVAVLAGTLAAIFMGAIADGMVNGKIYSAINTESSNIKIVNKDFLVNDDINANLTINDSSIDFLNNAPEIENWCTHLKITGVAQSAHSYAGVNIIGIDVNKEKNVTNLYTYIIPGTGDYFEHKTKSIQVVISDAIAEQLNIKKYRITDEVLDKLTEYGIDIDAIKKIETIKGKRFLNKKKLSSACRQLFSQSDYNKYYDIVRVYSVYYQHNTRLNFSFSGADSQLRFLTARVCGIYKTTNLFFDRMNVFVKDDVLRQYADVKATNIHEILIRIKDKYDPNDLKNLSGIVKKLGTVFPKAKVMTIKEHSTDAYQMKKVAEPKMYILILIIYIALAFGIINTMSMAILEREKELQMLRAVGLSRVKLFIMILMETFFLTIIGTIIGIVGAIFSVMYYHTHGITLFDDVLEQYGFSGIIYPELTTQLIVITIIIVLATALISSIVPVKHAYDKEKTLI